MISWCRKAQCSFFLGDCNVRLSDSMVVAVVFVAAVSPAASEASFRHRRACATCQPPVLQTGPQGTTSSAFLGLLPLLSFAQPVIQRVVERELFGNPPAMPSQCDLSDLSQVPEDPRITATRNDLADIQRKLGLTPPVVPGTPLGIKNDPAGDPPQPKEPQFFPID